MELLLDYGSDHEEDNSTTTTLQVTAAPSVALELPKDEGYRDRETKIVYHNPTFKQMFSAVQGPEMPSSQSLSRPEQNSLTGYVEEHALDDFVFDEQYHTFQSFGYASDPARHNTGGEEHFVGDSKLFLENQGATVYRQTASQIKARKLLKRIREAGGDPSDVDGYLGPWAPLIEDEEKAAAMAKDQEDRKKKWAEEQRLKKAEEEEEKKKRSKQMNESSSDDEEDDDTGPSTAELDAAGTTAGEKRRKKNLPDCADETTTYDFKEEQDYQGRSYMHCPQEMRNNDENHRCFIPKSWVHTWNGHTKAVSAIRWFPGSGHILLSASLDCSLKIWNVNSHRKCLRTINGHLLGIRDITFNNSGSQFLSISYDRWIKLWDTETGKCISRFSSGRIPFSARYHPGNENEFLVGQKDKLIVGWDVRQNAIIQRYEEHLSSVNTVTFVDEDRRFVSTSDDKKIFVWEYGIPVVIKHISEPHMHSVPFVMRTPDKKWIMGTSLDNQIIVFGAGGRFRQNQKKRFTGHNVAGFACQVDVSPNGQFVVSGDSEGRVFFWDWKTCKIYKRLRAHDKVTIGAIWHPVHPSKVATCSWDGTIKYWD
uniref:Pre-mRNA-processing factor 17 n=2 Tax=Hirondellea gigas TaxID=1518452 RepID=A0A6A7G766_9CRUS